MLIMQEFGGDTTSHIWNVQGSALLDAVPITYATVALV